MYSTDSIKSSRGSRRGSSLISSFLLLKDICSADLGRAFLITTQKEIVMKDYSEIQCPNCGGKILINAKLLLQGSNFSCVNQHCGASVSLSNSSYQVTNNAMKKFETLKQSQL